MTSPSPPLIGYAEAPTEHGFALSGPQTPESCSPHFTSRAWVATLVGLAELHFPTPCPASLSPPLAPPPPGPAPSPPSSLAVLAVVVQKLSCGLRGRGWGHPAVLLFDLTSTRRVGVLRARKGPGLVRTGQAALTNPALLAPAGNNVKPFTAFPMCSNLIHRTHGFLG